jgi:predicted amidohydrolase
LIAGCVTRPGEKYAVEELIITPEGRILGRQRKIHLRADDERILVPGDKFEVFKTEIGRVGIAENLYYPEVIRILTLSGAEIVFAPSNQFVPELKTWQTLVMARAAENLIPIVAVNPALWRTPEDLTGGQKDTPQGGGSLIVDIDIIPSIEAVPLPQIKVQAQAGQDEAILMADIDLEKTKEARGYWLARRKPGAYSLLVS